MTAAIASAFEAAISAPMVASPRARRLESRHPVAASADRRGPVPLRVRLRTGHRLDERDGREQRKVADRGHQAVMAGGVQVDRMRAAGKRKRPDDARVAAAHRLRDHPWTAAEEARVGRFEPAGLPACHRVAADERDAGLGRGGHEDRLGGRHVGHGRPGRQLDAGLSRAAGPATRRRGAAPRGSTSAAPRTAWPDRRRRVDHPGRQRRAWSLARRRPCDDLRPGVGRRLPQGKRDGSADQPEPKDRDAHLPIIRDGGRGRAR